MTIDRYHTSRCSIIWGCFRHWGDYKTALLECLHTAVQLTTYFRLHQENLRKKFIITLIFLNVRLTLKTKYMHVHIVCTTLTSLCHCYTLQLGADGGEIGCSEKCTSHPHLLLLCSQCGKPHMSITSSIIIRIYQQHIRTYVCT